MRTNGGQGQDGGAAAKINKAATSATDSKSDMTKVKSKGKAKATSRTKKQEEEKHGPKCQGCSQCIGNDVLALNCDKCGVRMPECVQSVLAFQTNYMNLSRRLRRFSGFVTTVRTRCSVRIQVKRRAR